MSEKVEVGNIVVGKVVKIKPFGAIVSLPNNSQGLVHISHISRSFVQNITDVLDVGDQVTVKILSSDADTGKISLSIKEAVADSKESTEGSRNRHSENTQHSSFNKRQSQQKSQPSSFEDKFKEWLKDSNERQAGLNKRNKRK